MQEESDSIIFAADDEDEGEDGAGGGKGGGKAGSEAGGSGGDHENPQNRKLPAGMTGENNWKVMVVDDDADVHAMTRMVLRNYQFEGRGLTFICGSSGKEAQQLMAEHPDTAILLLDVVMERQQAGLDAVQYIRETLQNPFVRIILRTGQPGLAPEQTVIISYDINDYKEKTELTAQKLITVVTASLRAYRDLRIIEENRRGLEKIIQATSRLFEPKSLKKLATGVLVQLATLLEVDHSALYVNYSGFAATDDQDQLRLYAGTGIYADMSGQTIEEATQANTLQLIQQAIQDKQSFHKNNYYVGYFCSQNGMVNILFLQGNKPLNPISQKLIDIFSVNVTLAFDNLYIQRDLIDSQRNLSLSLGSIIEAHSGRMENHLRRVSESARLLGQKIGLPEEDVELLRLSSPWHDLGKVAIPDIILTKPGSLSQKEWDVMKSHSVIGSRLLKKIDHHVMYVGATIAEMHHEQWDGLGYPKGVAAEEIPLFARITTLIDVFDTLCHDRYYEKAWNVQKVMDYMQQQRGKRFDPHLVDILLANLSEFQAIQAAFPESETSSNW